MLHFVTSYMKQDKSHKLSRVCRMDLKSALTFRVLILIQWAEECVLVIECVDCMCVQLKTLSSLLKCFFIPLISKIENTANKLFA